MIIDDELKEQALFKNKKNKNKNYVKSPVAKTNLAINESEDLISEDGDDDQDTSRSMIDENDHMDVEVERRMSKLIVDIDGVGNEKTKK